jgi:hypothetical protein
LAIRKQRLFIILTLSAIWAFAVAERWWSSNSVTASQPAAAIAQRTNPPRKRGESYGPPTELGRLQDPAISESSGLVASRTTPGLFWTHNDSGDGPFVYAIDRQGKSRGVWRVTGAAARDWEDIAAGPGPERSRSYLYAGDIGDNGEKRTIIDIYRFAEPSIVADDSRATRSKPRSTETAEALHFRYPDGKHDSETLLVHPVSGDLYLITKEFLGKAGVYKAAAPLNSSRTVTLVYVGALNIPSLLGGFVTGGDISPDGHRVAVCDYSQGYEIVIGNGNGFDAIWKQPINVISLGPRKQGEAIAYRLDGKALLATSEGARTPLIEIVRR